MIMGKGKVLVTGGAVFIGSQTVDILLENGYEVRVLDNLSEGKNPRDSVQEYVNWIETQKLDRDYTVGAEEKMRELGTLRQTEQR
jgi:nucleoside-diphosphate-sugar epimerase